MFIYIARHAWAGSFGDNGWSNDSLRELTNEGAERYMRMVQLMAERGFEPEVIATSPYIRCKQTAEIISKHTRHNPPIEELAALEPGSCFNELVDWTLQQGEKDVCWVGHCPDVDHMTAALIGCRDANIRFAKGAVAAVNLFSSVGHGAGELYWHATAKSLGI